MWGRRDFIKVGSLGMLGLNLADYFRMQAAGPAKDRSCILIWLSGGPAQTAASDISGTLAWAQGQSGYRGSAAVQIPAGAVMIHNTAIAVVHLMSRLRLARGGSGRVTDRRRKSRRS